MYNAIMSSQFEETLINETPLVVLDTETTGLHPGMGDRIVEIGALRLEGNNEVGTFEHLIYPDRLMNPDASAINHIYNRDLAGKPTFADIADEFLQFIDGAVMVAHNASFDANFIGMEMYLAGLAAKSSRQPSLVNPWICTLQLARRRFHFGRNNLGTVARRLQVRVGRAHRALGDVYTTAGVIKAMARQLSKENVVTIGDIFHAQGGAIYSAPPPDIDLPPQISEAISEQNPVELLYMDGGELDITIIPRYAMRHRGVPYLIGKVYGTQETRAFQLSMIFGVTPLG